MMELVEKRIILSSDNFVQKKQYWLATLEGSQPGIDLMYYHNKNTISERRKTEKFSVKSNIFEKLIKLSKNDDLSLFILLLTSLEILISKYSISEDIIVVTPTYKTNGPITFANDVCPIRTKLSPNSTFREFVMKVKDSVVGAYKNQDYPMSEIMKELNEEFDESAINKCISATMTNIHNESIMNNNINFRFLKLDNEIEIQIVYNNVVSKEIVVQYVNYFNNILYDVLNNSNKVIEEVKLITDNELKKILYGFNDVERDFNTSRKSIDYYFSRNVQLNPDKIAITHNDCKITFKQLYEKSNQYINCLSNRGIKKGDIVGVFLERSIDYIISIISTLRMGAAYLPLIPEYPIDRIKYILNDSSLKIIISRTYLLESKLVDYIDFINIDTINNFHTSLDLILPECSQSDIAYIIYTSGSTGNPKGVMIDQKSILNLIFGLESDVFNKIGTNLVFGLLSSFVFDASIQLTFGLLILGHSLHIISNDMRLEPKSLVGYIEKNKIDVIDGTPWDLSILSSVNDSIAEELKSLKCLLIGGEILYTNVIKIFLKKYPRKNYKIINVYGPTECSVDSTYFDINFDELDLYEEAISIGYPMKNKKIYILDKILKPVPIGVKGEIYISGEGITQGYINKPQLNIEKLLLNPWNEKYKMYRTGDIGYWLANGSIQFLNRIDNQVKIRGYRIELAEIEGILSQHPLVKNCVVIIREENNDKTLWAYYISNEKLEKEVLYTYLESKLPTYMIPTHLMQISEVPLNASGKINRKLLMVIGDECEVVKELEAPRNKIEEILVRVWKNVLQTSELGITETFFSLGGNSLKAIQSIMLLEKEGIVLKISDIFKHQNIKSISDNVFKRNTNELVTGMDDAIALLNDNFEGSYKYVIEKVQDKEFILLLGVVEELQHKKLIDFMQLNFDEKILPHYIMKDDDYALWVRKKFDIQNNEWIKDKGSKLLNNVTIMCEKYSGNIKNMPIANEFMSSPIQSAFFHLNLKNSGTIISLDEHYINYSLFNKAFKKLISQHTLLRSKSIKKEDELHFIEFSTPNEILIPYLDLSSYSPAIQQQLINFIITRLYYMNINVTDDLLYKVVLIKKNEKEFLLALPCHHSIFDAMSKSIITNSILSFYKEKLYENNSSIFNVYNYVDYINQINKGPQHISEQEIISLYKLEEYYENLLIIKNNMEKSNYRTLVFKKSIDMNSESIWELSIKMLMDIVAKSFNINKIPMIVFNYGRRYEGKSFFEHFGAFIDFIPVVLNKEKDLPKVVSETIQDCIEKSAKYNINFAAFIYNNVLSKKFKKINRLLDINEIPTIIFNYIGEVSEKDLSMSSELTDFDIDSVNNEIEKSMFNGFIFEVMHTKNTIRISISTGYNLIEEEIEFYLNKQFSQARLKD